MDVNMVVLLIISIGLAVDFSAHIGYTFMTVSGTKNGTLSLHGNRSVFFDNDDKNLFFASRYFSLLRR